MSSLDQQILAAEQALSKLDPVLGMAIAKNEHISREPRDNYFASLASSITGQQISVKAAASILGRLKEVTSLDPAKVAALDEVQIKTIGLSRQKASYLKDLAEHFVRDSAVFNHLDSLSDEEVILELTKVKGIGVWTAQMFLMFTLVRMDVFAPDDAGLQQAIKRLYKLDTSPKRSELITFAERWQPYRSVASWHLWAALDNEPK